MAALTPIDVLGEMVSIGTLFAFALVCGAVVYLRKSDAEIFRPFRTPAVPWVPSFGIAFSLLLMVFLPWETWLRLIVWLAIGLVLYFAYGRSHSVLMNGGEALSGAYRLQPTSSLCRSTSAGSAIGPAGRGHVTGSAHSACPRRKQRPPDRERRCASRPSRVSRPAK